MVLVKQHTSLLQTFHLQECSAIPTPEQRGWETPQPWAQEEEEKGLVNSKSVSGMASKMEGTMLLKTNFLSTEAWTSALRKNYS